MLPITLPSGKLEVEVAVGVGSQKEGWEARGRVRERSQSTKVPGEQCCKSQPKLSCGPEHLLSLPRFPEESGISGFHFNVSSIENQ